MTFSVPSVKTVEDLWGAFKVATLKLCDDGASWFKVCYILAIAVLVILLARKLLFWPRVNLPPGPPGLPFLGHMHLLGASPHRSLAEMAQKYGPLMFIRLGVRPCIVCSSPETAKEFLKTQDANFGSRPYTSQGQHLLYGRQDVAFQATNPTWRHLKKIFTTELASPSSVESSRHIRTSEVACMLRSIYSLRSVELKSQLSSMLSNVISRTVLNKRYIGNPNPDSTNPDSGSPSPQQIVEKDFPEMVQTHFRLAGLFVPGDFVPALRPLDLGGIEAQMRKHKVRMDAFVSEIVEQHRERRRKGRERLTEEERDYVDVLLDQMEMEDTGFQMSEDHVKALILDAFLAATETMILTCEWAMAELLHHPHLFPHLHSELDSVVGRSRPLQESDLPHLPFLHALIKETFRLHPPAPLLLPRESSHPSHAFGYNFPAKTRVIVNVWAIGRDPTLWEDPEKFHPERWLEEKMSAVDVKGQHFELLAFGSGRRVCPAVNLGVTVVQFVVGSLLQGFEWGLAEGLPEELDMEEVFGLTLPRKGPLPCVATPRLAPECY